MQAIILAGGKGTRLRPYTTILPKPMMPIGDMPILEILIRQLKQQGVESIIIAVGYLHHIIESYFENGKKYGVPISYSIEKGPLGTAGPMHPILDNLEEDFLILNGDLLTSINFKNLFGYHLKQNAAATIATFERTVNIDYGVLELDQNFELENYSEKPSFNYKVSMGINVFKKSAIKSLIQKEKYFDMPNLMMKLKQNNQKVSCYQEDCEWLDIGRLEDYSIAVETYESKKEKFLTDV